MFYMFFFCVCSTYILPIVRSRFLARLEWKVTGSVLFESISFASDLEEDDGSPGDSRITAGNGFRLRDPGRFGHICVQTVGVGPPDGRRGARNGRQQN